MLSKADKEKVVVELRDKLARATSVFLADYRGLDVRAVEELRRKLHAEGDGSFEYRVAKNTLVRRAAGDSPVADLTTHLQGPTALALSYGDPVRLAKILVDYAKTNDPFELRVGWVEGRALEEQEIATLATLPTLEQLRARLVGLIQAPATKVAQVLVAPGAQVARVVEARRKQLEEADSAS